MSLPLVASFAVAVGVGLFVTRAIVPPIPSSASRAVLMASVAVGLGLGLVACSYFGWMIVLGPTADGLVVFEGAMMGGAGVVGAYLARRTRLAGADARDPNGGSGSRLLGGGFAVALTCAAGALVALAVRAPHGGWDAWMTWNVRARFLFRSGEDWRAIFAESSPLRHTDYPLLLPSLIARSWSYAGGEALAAPVLLAVTFTLATVGVLWSSVALLRGRSQAALAGLVLVSTPFFITHGASQYADLPVALYLTTALALLCLHDRYGTSSSGLLVLAGLAAGLAAWVKNEGLLFVVALLLARILVLAPKRGARVCLNELRPMVAGIVPALLVVLVFKLRIAPANELLSTSAQGIGTTIDRVTDPERYVYIVTHFADLVVSFGSNGFVSATWLLVTYLVCVGVNRRGLETVGVRTGLLALGLIVCGHGLVFLTAPSDWSRLLDGSIQRLFLQLWPGILLMYFLSARNPEETVAISPVAAAEREKGAHEIGQAA